MADWLTRASLWMRALASRTGDLDAGTQAEPNAADADFTDHSLPPSVALLLTETLVSEAIAHGGQRHPGGLPTAAGDVLHGNSVPLTATGVPVQEHCAGHDDGIVAIAAGYAVTGTRAAAFVGGVGLGRARQALEAAASQRAAVVIHANLGERGTSPDHLGYELAATTGAAVAMATSAQQQLDLALVARRLSEDALLPVVVGWDGRDSARPLLLPSASLIGALLGGPDDLVESTVAAQEHVFAGPRRRLPRWFDGLRPSALGAPASPASRAAASAARDTFFDAAIGPLLADAAETFAARTGRSVGPLLGHRLADASFVVVAQGAVFADVCAAVDRARARGVQAGALAVVWLRPLATAEIAAALHGAESIAALERQPSRLGTVGALSALAGAGRAVDDVICVRYGLAGALPTAPELDEVFDRLAAGERPRNLVLGATDPAAQRATAGRPSARRRVLQEAAARLSSAHTGAAQTARATVDTSPPPIAGDHLPMAVRQLGRSTSDWASVARFWGETYQPLGGATGTMPEPYLALSSLPAGTATFRDRAPTRGYLPEIDIGACTGCGRCWTACPEAAIAPVALGTQALLEASLQRALGDSSTAGGAGRLRRAFKQIAPRIERELAEKSAEKTHVLRSDVLDDAAAWLFAKMDLGDDEQAAMYAALAATGRALSELPAAACPSLFAAAHRAKTGSGALLMLAVDAHSCQACGLCAEVCGDGAVTRVPQTEDRIERARLGWRAWEQLPDTPGSHMTAAARSGAMTQMAAILLSRHCLLTLPGGDEAEPGSGARIAVRLTTAAIESVCQEHIGGWVKDLGTLAAELRAKMLATAGASVLAELAGKPAGAGKQSSTLERMDSAVRALDRLTWELGTGHSGAGMARYAAVVAGQQTATWLVSAPHNPFTVPAVVDVTDAALDQAVGLAMGMSAGHVARVRTERLARLALQSPADFPERAAQAAGARWADLDDADVLRAPPLLLIGDLHAICEAGAAGLQRVLRGDQRVLVLVLDDRELPLAGPDPALLALVHRGVFVAATSIAAPDHLLASVVGALAQRGPALLHVHAPRPAHHGYESEQTLARAELATQAGIHPLLRYDPSTKGVFGSRLQLDGPHDAPAAVSAAVSAAVTVAEWAAGERRFDGVDLTQAAAERADHLAVLRELAGLTTPFADRVKQQAAADLAAAHDAELVALRSEYEARLSAQAAAQQAAQAERLKRRLLQLAGHPAVQPAGSGEAS